MSTTEHVVGPDDIDQRNPYAIRSIVQLIQLVEDGQLAKDLSEDLVMIGQELIALEIQGGKGKAEITLKLGMKLDRGLVEIEGNYAVKLPKKRRARTMMHLGPDGVLARHDHRQLALPMRDAHGGDAGKIRTVVGG